MNRTTKKFVAYYVAERNGKFHWTKLGFGELREDGEIRVKLDAIPIDGTLRLREELPVREA